MPKPQPDERNPSSRTYLTEFGKKVRSLRENRGVTLKQLAQLSGLSDRYIIQVEQGTANPSLDSVLRLAVALETSVPELLPEDGKNKSPEPGGPTRKFLQLLEGRSRDEIVRIVDAVSGFLEPTKGRHIALVGMRGAGKS